MKVQMTPAEFASKVDHEGGVYSALEYGLHYDDLDDGDPDLKKAWFALELAWVNLQPVIAAVTTRLDTHLDEYVEED